MLRLAIAHNRLSSSFNAAFIDTITHSSPSSVNVAVGDDMFHIFFLPGRVAQLVAHLTQEPDVPGSIPGPAAYFCFSFRWFKKYSCQLRRKYVHEVLVYRLGGLSQPRESVVG